MWAFVLGNWKWIAIGLVVVGLVGYVETIKIERDHYKADRDAVKAEFEAFQKENKSQHDVWASENAALTLKIKQQGIEELKQIAQNKEDKDAKILALNLNRILSDELVSVLSGGAQAPAGSEGTTSTDPGHASGTGTPATTDSPFTEEDIALTWDENEFNAKACIVIVHKWQNLWKGLVSNTPG